MGWLPDQVGVRPIKLSWATKVENYKQQLISKSVKKLGGKIFEHKLGNKQKNGCKKSQNNKSCEKSYEQKL